MDFRLKTQEVRKDFLLVLFSVTVGFLSTSFSGRSLLGFWGLMPLLWLETRSRRAAFFAPLVFFLVISRGIVPGAFVFFRDGSLLRASALWLASNMTLALPWILIWSADSKTVKGAGLLFALLASVPPPLGFIGWGNPLTAAGLFFPGWGWTGLGLMLGLYYAAAKLPKLRYVLFIAVFLSAPLLKSPPIPERVTIDGVTILGIDTSFDGLSTDDGDAVAQYERERMLFAYVNALKRSGKIEGADVVILPETVIGRMYSNTMRRITRFFTPYADQGTIFVVGGEQLDLYGPNSKYDNTMVTFGPKGEVQIALQRFPVPFSMYRPFSSWGANAYPLASGKISTITLHGKNLGFLVCYEHFLSWPVLSLIWESPDAIIAPSNLWWCVDSSLIDIRAAVLYSWARLFEVALISSVNL